MQEHPEVQEVIICSFLYMDSIVGPMAEMETNMSGTIPTCACNESMNQDDNEYPNSIMSMAVNPLYPSSLPLGTVIINILVRSFHECESSEVPNERVH